jgi:hypothetical protein
MADGYSHGSLRPVDPDTEAERLAAERKQDHVEARVPPLLEMAWGLIANAHSGNWDTAPAAWREAAERWRDEYHGWLRTLGFGDG